MVIKINTVKAGTPVEIGELHFIFDTSDNALQKLEVAAENFVADMAKIKGNDLEAVKEVLKNGYDLILGEGAFEQIYQQTPSVTQCVNILEELCNSLTADLQTAGNKNTQQAKVEHYLNQKKQKKQKKRKK